MTYSTEIAKRVSTRHCLLRLRPSRDITSQLVYVGGGVYQATFSYRLDGIARNGSNILTQTTANPPTVNDTYYFDESSSTLLVKLASAPNASSNIIIASYFLFYSSGDSVFGLNPTDSSTETRFWEPLIKNEPVIQQAVENIEAGIVTVSSFSIEVNNRENHLSEYFSDDDSFYQKPAYLWSVVNGVPSLVYIGKVDSVTIDSKAMTLEIYDDFTRLNLPCYMGDAASESYNTRDKLKDFFSPVPFVFGNSRGDRTQQNIDIFDEDISAPGPGIQRISGGLLDYSTMERASFDAVVSSTISGTINRGPWLIARTSGDFRTLNFGTLYDDPFIMPTSSAGSDDAYFTIRGLNYAFLLIPTTGSNLQVGDSFTFTHASLNSGATQYAIVSTVVESQVGSGPAPGIWCILKSRSSVGAKIILSASGMNLASNQAPALVIKSSALDSYGGVIPLAFEKDFTISITTLSSGNKLMRITLVNNFETATNIDGTRYHGSLTALHPSWTNLHYKIYQDSAYATHGQCVKTILTGAGISPNAASITAADSSLAAKVQMTIPSIGESEYADYFTYLQIMLRSTLGYVTMDMNSNEAKYELLVLPSTGTSVTDDDYSSEIGVSASIEYRDIVTSIAFANKTSGYTVTKTNNAARHLHGVEKRISLDTVLENSSEANDRQEAILSLLSKRRVTYRFGVATKLLAALISDDVTLTSPQVLGSIDTKNLKLITLEKSSETVIAEARDLLGL